jgi:hypothetical protein
VSFAEHLASQKFFPYLAIVAMLESTGLLWQTLAYMGLTDKTFMFIGLVVEYIGVCFLPKLLRLVTESRAIGYAVSAAIIICGAMLENTLFSYELTNFAYLILPYFYFLGVTFDIISGE